MPPTIHCATTIAFFCFFISPYRSSLSFYSCMDASIAIKPVFERFQTVIITSGVKVDALHTLLFFTCVHCINSLVLVTGVRMLKFILHWTMMATFFVSYFQDSLSFGYLSTYSGFSASHHGIFYNDTHSNLSVSPGT